MKNITLICASYNTPTITSNMLKSFCYTNKNTPILICDNSTNNDTEVILNQSNIPYFKNSGGLHGPSVDLLLEKVATDYVLLVDSDVIFLRSAEQFFNQASELDLTLAGEVVGDRGGKLLYSRVNPWFCIINAKKAKNNNIKFFDKTRMEQARERKYDVGSTFFEDVKKAKLGIGHIAGENHFYRHYEGMSWRIEKFGTEDGNIDLNPQATHNNIALKQHGLKVLNQYKLDTKCFNNIELTYEPA